MSYLTDDGGQYGPKLLYFSMVVCGGFINGNLKGFVNDSFLSA